MNFTTSSHAEFSWGWGEVTGGEFPWENSVRTKPSFPKALLIYVIEELRTTDHPGLQEEESLGQILMSSKIGRDIQVGGWREPAKPH